MRTHLVLGILSLAPLATAQQLTDASFARWRDYVLPSADLDVVECGVYWPPPSDPASVVNSLTVVRGGQVYLIKAGAAATLPGRLRAAEFSTAVGPLRSAPCTGETPSESGVLALRPSGVAPMTEPKYTCNVVGNKLM